MKVAYQKIKLFKIIGFLAMIGLMIVLNNNQEDAKLRTGKKDAPAIVNIDPDKGLIPVATTIPSKTEGSIPLQLISRPNSNFLIVLNNCQHFLESVRFLKLRENFLLFCAGIHYNFITEYLATIRNKDYK